MTTSYEDYRDQYVAWMANLPPTDYASHLPQGYATGCRTWDFWMIDQWANFQPTSLVLDTGCWQCFDALWWARKVKRIFATDSFYWTQRDFVKEQHLQGALEWQACIQQLNILQNVITQTVDVQHIQFPDRVFDQVLSISTIEHVLDDAKAMSEMVRVLKPGGRLLITTEYDETQGKPYLESDGSWYRVYNRETWDALLGPYNVIHRDVDIWRGPHYFRTAFCVIEKAL